MKHAAEKQRSLLLSCVLAQIPWLISAIVFLLLFCAVANTMEDPDSVLFPLSLCALYLSAIVGGIGAVRLSGDGVLSGALSGLLTALIVFVLSALPWPASGLSPTLSLILTLLIVPASALGAILGHRRPKNPRKQIQRSRRKHG